MLINLRSFVRFFVFLSTSIFDNTAECQEGNKTSVGLLCNSVKSVFTSLFILILCGQD